METLSVDGKPYEVDGQGFLTDRDAWDEGFAEVTAPACGIPGGLSGRHWEVIRFIRDEFARTGGCPLVYSTCRAAGLRLRDLKALFPTGYLRGACRLAGITYRDRFVDYFGESAAPAAHATATTGVRSYRTDAFGFLVDPGEWDETWATGKAAELGIPGSLTAEHWRVLRSLRARFAAAALVPTVIECCEANDLELDDLEALFPGGYQRAVVKLAGLCVRPG